MYSTLYSVIKKTAKALLPVIVILSMPALRAEGSAVLRVVQREEAYIGCEVVLTLDGNAAAVKDASYEWTFEGSAKPILFRRGGLESRLTPVDTNPITAHVSAFGSDGRFLASADITLTASEFTVEILMIEPAPFMLWDANAKQDAAADGLIAGEPVQFEARLAPNYDRPIRCAWSTDASTAILGAENEQMVTIVRNDIGDAELSIVVRDAGGLVLGRGAKNVHVPISRTRVDESIRRRKAWNQWQEAQSLWDAKNFDDAVENAAEASKTDPETIEITKGFETMSANYARVLRSRKLVEDASALHGEQNLIEALKIYRRAYAAWALSETEASIRALESDIDKMRIRRQQAEWLRDIAAAYDQEGLFENALRYYKETLVLQHEDSVAQRAERIENRLASIAKAKEFSGEGRELEAAGQLLEAVDKYKESLKFETDAALEAHTRELEETIRERRTRATALRREATDLQRRNNSAEALLRFRESYSLWAEPELEKIISDLEKTVTETTEQVVRTAEDFGIGTQADAARLLQEGHALYRDGKYKEALEIYHKSFAISKDVRLAEWISRVETSLKEYEAVLQANLLIKEANNLYNEGNHAGALEKYRESLSIHPNAEVENFINMLETTSFDIRDVSIRAGG
ncbi:MAG: hypothetical protein FWG71_03840 [Synergistaceae bacterium]|nr:hypothetical protein [Synergistaceae bacterium]